MNLPSHPSRTFPYEIEKQVGEGAMGAVYLARETTLDRKVAIKTLRPEFLQGLDEKASKEAMHRFLQEARAIARLSHRGIVSVYRMGTENGAAFIAMEWLDGHTLEDVLATEARLDVHRAARWTMELLEAVDAAHRNDIIHRDIKPANVMLVSGDQIKLTDFGVARVKGSKLVKTQVGSMIGTPLYAPPEQLSDAGVDPRADLYSIGVLLYEMLTGSVPYYDSNIVRLVNTIMHEAPPPIRETNPTVPASLAELVYRALAKDPSDRFASARAMAEELASVLPETDAGLEMSTSDVEATTLPGPPTPATAPETVRVSGTTACELVAATVTDWEPRAVGPTDPDRLLDRLVETPLHAEPFSGAAQLDERIFLLSRGLIYGAVDRQSGETGDIVHEQLPDQVQATLYPLPDHLDERLMMNLGSLLHPPDRKHADLDTAYTDMAKLYQRLCADRFDGALRLEDGDRLAFLLVHRGRPLLEIFSTGWDSIPRNGNWRSWIEGRSLTAHVERRRTRLSAATYRRELRDLLITVGPNSKSGDEPNPTFTATTDDLRVNATSLDERVSRASTIWKDIYESDIAFQLLRWLRRDLSPYLRERERLDKWKYLAGWTELIDHAHLYHQLERPGEGERDPFDLVTYDDTDKVLHLGRRVVHGTVEQLNLFIDEVETAKKARIKRGDVGGAVLVADEFEPRAVEAYHERVHQESSSWWFGLQESMTGYEGFVRMGSRRGFHLLLVRRTCEGFAPVLPPKQ